jgi:hypothetical protein
MVSAFAVRQRMVLGQVKVSEKSNEIVAIPALLEMLEWTGAGAGARLNMLVLHADSRPTTLVVKS